ncbi:hypothetical protein Bbelb_430320 [Branchiostoma belcheri]|nr:hypothetical protein Bbelb_430320 [Branchiostoma belcheri]
MGTLNDSCQPPVNPSSKGYPNSARNGNFQTFRPRENFSSPAEVFLHPSVKMRRHALLLRVPYGCKENFSHHIDISDCQSFLPTMRVLKEVRVSTPDGNAKQSGYSWKFEATQTEHGHRLTRGKLSRL